MVDSSFSNAVKVVATPRRKSPHSKGAVGLLITTIAVLFNLSMMYSLEPISTDSFLRLGNSVRQRPEAPSSSSPSRETKPTMPQDAGDSFHPKNEQSTPSDVTYPLTDLKLPSAHEAYTRGFRQRMSPVPLDRWTAVSNTTCLAHSTLVTDWKRRVPHVIIIGSQKGGTTALSYYLYSHPVVQYLPPKELNFFDDELDHNPTLVTNGSGIHATRFLDYYQGITIGDIVPLLKFELEDKYAFDATPNYLFLSDRVPQRILCVTPWVKLVAILRDPVERAFSQYHMQLQRDLASPEGRRGTFVSFEEYISMDMKVLQDTGVLPQGYGGWHAPGDDETYPNDFDISIVLEEKVVEAWSIYTKLGVNSPVGRGLYSIQLSQWFRAMDSVGKPRSDLLVMPSRRLLDSPNQSYSEIIEFLGLSPHSLTKYSRVHETMYQGANIQPEIRAKLQAFFMPFNRQLEGLLLEKEWGDIWDHHDEP